MQLPDSQSTPALYSQAERWHVSFSSEDMDVGYRFELRKLAYPKEISSGGALPLRFWFVNTGTAPCYEPVTAMLRLSGADKGCDTKLNIQALQGKTGDLVHNEIAKLPALPTGEYTVSLGLKIGEHPLALANALTASDGFYALGKVLVDQQNRDDLFHIWEDYYPEGYYPLEDPQAPNESGEEQQSGGDGK